MAKQKEEVLEVSEKDKDAVTTLGMIEILIKRKKEELEDLNHKLLLIKTNSRAVEESCKRAQSEFNQRMAGEKQKFHQEREGKLNEFSVREDRLQQGERHQTEREIRIKEREIELVKVEEERKFIYQERIDIEKLKNNAQIELQKTLSLQAEAQGKINNAVIKEKQAEDKLSEAKQLNSNVEYKLGMLAQKEKDIQQQLDNLEKIRSEITPKIAELDELNKKNQILSNDMQVKNNNLEAKIKEDRTLLDKIAGLNKTLRDKELELISREEEILRQEITLKTLKEKK